MAELKPCKKCNSIFVKIDCQMTPDNGVMRPLWFVNCMICKDKNRTGFYYKRGNAINAWQKKN